ncbi:MAG: DUF1801 domain-containing protein [Anaerolineae bacterium]|nr:DUF1801 domain-containing protein [Anaerolineae bacterium]
MNKTQPTDDPVNAFLEAIEDPQKKADSLALVELMRQATGHEPRLWGNIVGFGQYHYKYASGREGDAFLAGFAPRKGNLTLYIMAGFEQYDALLARLGKFKTGKACLYLKKLADVDMDVLRELVQQSAAHMVATNPPPG